jgi:hypothetical protein
MNVKKVSGERGNAIFSDKNLDFKKVWKGLYFF